MREPPTVRRDLTGRFPHLVGWWIEITPEESRTRKRFLRSAVTTQQWRWTLKRPDGMMPFGFSISGSGKAKSEDRAIQDAIAKAAWWEEWNVRQGQTRRIAL